MKVKTLLITTTLLGLISVLGGCSRWGGVESPTGPSEVTPKVFMDPSTVSKSTNSPFTISVYIENVTDLYFANIYIKYDPDKLSYVDGAEGSFLDQGGASTSFFAEEVESGIVNVAITRLSPKSGASGTGVLCTMTFKGTASNSQTNISFLNEAPYYLGFRDANEEDVKITVGNGTTVNIL
jgi:general secretion pathway protein D